RHQCDPFFAGGATRTAWNSTEVQEGQLLTDNIPARDRRSAFGSIVATSESSRPFPQPASSDHVAEGTTEALSDVPSRTPEPVDLGPFTRVRVKFLPDCEMARAASGVYARVFPHGRAATWTGSACTCQTPSTEIGAVSERPCFNTPTSPTIGRPTKR